ncbi:ExeM/NucH family extracellular endonuclease [Aeromicrobium fastidiosum]|uniref:ExeM/NucH family extracellular endonuclease n=1 Tax=Aeromicrobium fastidiosum TaxID=52699 RepID=A0A641AKT3_9ACTN|nr:ExeM/NucH family extracellular endonuclease [Aeromicrobium fastidiosum]KAA1374566.1 ExeM/NucH family extracellular endonuclease [Aeromicrobium fastidiosum]MBP2390897.1 putative extracellular nuclease [Aeromicrobium fastidiosum]
MNTSIITRGAAAAAVAIASLIALPATPASAAGAGVVINEIYPNGGSGGGTYQGRFYELYNSTDQAVSVDGWSLQYRSPLNVTSDFGQVSALGDTTIPAGGYLLIAGPGNGANAKPLPKADVTSSITAGAGGGQIALSTSIDPLPGDDVLGADDLVDLVGYGTAKVFEGTAVAPTGSATNGITRASTHADTDDNAADFSSAEATPCSLAGCATVTPPDPPVATTIAEVQGTGFTSPLVGTNVTVKGVVTATYTSGAFDGAYIQTEGTGDVDLADHKASDGVFVSSLAFAKDVEKGDFVSVTGIVSESFGLTQIATPDGGWSVIDSEQHDPVEPAAVTFPLTSAQRESLEGMLLDVEGTYTVTNNYTTDRFGDIGLVDGDEPLDQPTNVVAPGEAAKELQARNDARLITLDDGADIDRFTTDKNIALPWLTKTNQLRVGAKATIDEPVILDYRRSLWRLQPTERLVAGEEPATFTSTRSAKPAAVGGDVTIGTFNVLNYFTTTGQAYEKQSGEKCEFFADRAGTPIAVDDCGDGPRGAATSESLERQQAKIVTAINTLGADVVSLEEIENSARLGLPRDTALSALVTALNAKAGDGTWAFVPSPTAVPTGEDVIRTGFIYKPAAVETVGGSTILTTASAFDNAREPLAQTFKVAGGTDDSRFAVIVNHFKSKGSGSGTDADSGDGQGGSNASRTAQATALVGFAQDVADDAGTDRVFLTGDFNSYNKEDPVDIIEKAGFVNVAAELTDKETYQFEGQVGSLDHVFASGPAFGDVTGADIWNINSYESPGREYSRYNYNLVDLFDGTTPFRASDHDPELVGFDAEKVERATVAVDAPATIRAGQALSLGVTVSGGDATPTGTVAVVEGEKVLASASLKGGAAQLAVPDLPIGSHVLSVRYSGDEGHAASSASVSTTVLKTASTLTASAASGTYGTSAVLSVTGSPGASGLVYVAAGDQLVGLGTMSDGRATINLSSTLPVGTTPLTVFYAGDATVDPTSTTTTVTVAKAATRTRVGSVKPTRIVRNRTKPFVEVRVTADGFVVDGGTVTLRSGGKMSTATVRNGKARVRLGTFTSSGSAKKVRVTYSGSSVAEGSTSTFTVRVRRR